MNPRFQHKTQREGRISSFAVIVLIALLVCPMLASVRLAQSFKPQFICGYIVAISVITFWLYRHDKRRAETNGWRTPEATLHLLELFGGWPAAFLAQRAFRHKITKTSYQAGFWLIVALHQIASFDLLQDWHYSRSALLFSTLK